MNISIQLAAANPSEKYTEADLFSLSLDELSSVQIKVEVASLFIQSKLEVGSSVWSIDDNEWERQSAETVTEAIQRSPGVYAMDLFGTLVPSFRGFAHQETARDSLFLFDGVPVNSYSFQGSGQSFSLLDLGVLEKVETIRGPGSSIYGASASHGVVSLKSWSPNKDTTQFTAEAGSSEYIRFVGRTHHKFGEKRSTTLVVAGNNNADRGIDYEYTNLSTSNTETDELQKTHDVSSIFGKVELGDANISMLWNKWDRGGLTASYGRPPAENGGQYSAEGESALVKASYSWALPKDYYIDSFLAYQQQEYMSFSPRIAGKPASSKPTTVIVADENHASAGITVKRPRTKSKPTQLAFGYHGNHYHIDELSRFLSTASSYTEGAASGRDRAVHSAFFQTDTAFLDGYLNLLIGARYDNYNDVGSHTSPRVGVILHPTQDSAVKFLYGHAFRAPSGLEQGGLPSILVPAENNLDPETIDTYEISYLAERKDMSYELTLFHSTVEENVSIVPNTGPEPEPFAYTNTLSGSSKGIELVAKWKATDDLQLDISGTSVSTTSDDEDQYRAFPRQMLHWGMNYFFLRDRASLSVYNTHYFNMQSSDGFDTSLPDYWNTDLNLQYRLAHKNGQPVLSFSIGNLFDRSDITSVSSTTENGQPQEPIHFKVGVRFTL